MARCNIYVDGIGHPSYTCRRRASHGGEHWPLTRWDARLFGWLPYRIRHRIIGRVVTR